MLNLYQSNSLDALAHLWRAVRQLPADPLAPETLLVPSKGMQRWLALWLARQEGIAANLDFQLPAAFVWRLIRLALPQVQARTRFDPEVLAWRALQVLPAVLARHPEAAIAPSWREADAAGRYQLAWRVADVFDQYLIYRPDWCSAWEAGRLRGLGSGEPWQAVLWQTLAQGQQHRGHRLQELAGLLKRGNTAGLPAQLSLFGIGSLPPAYWELVQLLGQQLDIDCFLLNPSQEYWGQIQRGEEGSHALLAALGQQGRDFISQVAASGVSEPVGSQAFVESQEGTLLATLQNDLLVQRLRDPQDRELLDTNDDSLSVQVCHSPLREVEVLHDRLLQWLEADPTLQADQILVMVSDIQRYAPLVDAVFGTRREPALPYTIADRRLELEEPLLARFFELLALPASRFELPRVLALLEEPALCSRFGLADGDVDTIQRWCTAVQIRWGRDDADRRRQGLEPLPISWRAGLDRLLLGFMLPPELAPDADTRLAGISPAEAVASVGQARVLARFAGLIETLLYWEGRLYGQRSLADWAAQLNLLLQAFFAETEGSSEALQHLRAVLAELVEQAELVGEGGRHEFAVMQAWLKRQIGGLEARRGFLHGAITVCAMVPMRSLPFRVIAVLGLDDGVFPRHQRPWHFDLMAEHPRAGDRSRRLDDRYLFLETLLAAREKLYLSYVGRSDVDDTARAPSPVLLELLDQVADTAGCADPTHDVRVAITTEHALQPFHPRYFTRDVSNPSYVSRFFSASQALAKPIKPRELEPDFSAILPAAEISTLELPRLEKFLRHPVRFFLQDCLGIRLEASIDQLESGEPVDTAHTRRALRERLLPLESVDAAIFRAEGLIPAGSWGERLLYSESAQIDPLREPVREARATFGPPLSVSFTHEGVTLTGSLNDVGSGGIARWTLNERIYASDVLHLWLHHLLLCHTQPECVDLHSRLLSLGGSVEMPPVAEPERHLKYMVAAFLEGQRRPLPLFMRASPVFIRQEGDMARAEAAYDGNDYARGDRDDPWHELVWPRQYPLGEDFELWSGRIYGPLKDYLPS